MVLLFAEVSIKEAKSHGSGIEVAGTRQRGWDGSQQKCVAKEHSQPGRKSLRLARASYSSL